MTLPGRRPTKTMKSSKNCRTSSFQVFPGSLRTQRYFLISKTFCLIFYQFVERCFPNNYSILLRVQGSRDTSRSLSCDSGRSSLYTRMNFITQVSNIGTLVKICNIYWVVKIYCWICMSSVGDPYLLCAHLDVVPTGERERWWYHSNQPPCTTTQPFPHTPPWKSPWNPPKTPQRIPWECLKDISYLY